MVAFLGVCASLTVTGAVHALLHGAARQSGSTPGYAPDWLLCLQMGHRGVTLRAVCSVRTMSQSCGWNSNSASKECKQRMQATWSGKMTEG